MKFSGIVKKNLGRGTRLGFPTANIEAPKDTEDGIFFALANGRPALVFIGRAETFEEHDRKAEIYILDFSGSLYGQEIKVEILKKHRDNQKFSSEADLIVQMNHDKEVAKEFFKSYNTNN